MGTSRLSSAGAGGVAVHTAYSNTILARVSVVLSSCRTWNSGALGGSSLRRIFQSDISAEDGGPLAKSLCHLPSWVPSPTFPNPVSKHLRTEATQPRTCLCHPHTRVLIVCLG